MNPLDHEWHTDETQDGNATIYVLCATSEGQEYAHCLFDADWGSREHADHIAKLHNAWLKERNERG